MASAVAVLASLLELEGPNAEETVAALTVLVGLVPIGVSRLVDWRRENRIYRAEELDLLEREVDLKESDLKIKERTAAALEALVMRHDPGERNGADPPVPRVADVLDELVEDPSQTT